MTIATPPENCNVIGCKWVFTVKTINGRIIRYKARLVAQAFKQIHGVYYTETFSPVVHKKTIRTLLAIAVETVRNDTNGCDWSLLE
jgi:hypothetical protein